MAKKGSSLPYSLRPNKAVDRDVFVDFLAFLNPILDLHNYRYIGLGGPFLEDFHMIGIRVGITDMVSVETDPATIWRQHHNRPPFVKIVQNKINSYIGEAQLDEKPHAIWFDYTDGGHVPSKYEVLARAASEASGNSVFKVTLNASPPNLPVGVQNPAAIRLAEGKERLGNYAPADMTSEHVEDKQKWASVLVNALDISLKRNLKNVGFVPVTSAIYADNAPIVTATFITCDKGEEEQLYSKIKLDKWSFYNADWTQPFLIDIPALSPIERAMLDCKIDQVSSGSLDGTEFRDALDRLGTDFKVPKGSLGSGDEVVQSFYRFRRLFPEFARLSR